MEIESTQEEENVEEEEEVLFAFHDDKCESFYFSTKFLHTTRLLKLKQNEFFDYGAFIIKGKNIENF